MTLVLYALGAIRSLAWTLLLVVLCLSCIYLILSVLPSAVLATDAVLKWVYYALITPT